MLNPNQFTQNPVWIANTSRCTGPVRIATRYNVRKINKDNLHYINIWDQKVQNSVFYEAFVPIIWIVNVWNQMLRVTSRSPEFRWYACNTRLLFAKSKTTRIKSNYIRYKYLSFNLCLQKQQGDTMQSSLLTSCHATFWRLKANNQRQYSQNISVSLYPVFIFLMLVVYICLLSGYSPNKPKQKFEAK